MNGPCIGQDIKYSLNAVFLPKRWGLQGVWFFVGFFFLNKGLRIGSHHLLVQRDYFWKFQRCFVLRRYKKPKNSEPLEF